jgi:hypothetical protein
VRVVRPPLLPSHRHILAPDQMPLRKAKALRGNNTAKARRGRKRKRCGSLFA